MAGTGLKIAKNIVGGIALAVSIGTVAAAYGGIINPETTPLPAILALTFPIWLATATVMLITMLCIKPLRKLALIPAIALLLSGGPVMSHTPINIPHAKAHNADNTFTLMSFNVFALRDITSQTPFSTDPARREREIEAGITNPTIGYLLDKKADLLFLQEFNTALPNKHLHITEAQADSLTAFYPYRRNVSSEYLFSPWELTPVALQQPESPYASFAAATANIMGHETLLVSVHLQSIGLSDDDKELYRDLTKGEGGDKITQVKHQLLGKLADAFKKRAKQARLLRQQIDSLGIENVIIAGDFNDTPDCYALRQICRDDFHNAFTEAGCGPAITYHANRFFFHIDHIIYRGHMRAVGFERGTCPNSDHYPIIATFEWETPADNPLYNSVRQQNQ